MIGNGKIFISHTHRDNQACDPLLAALDAWQIDYWFDLEQLSAGQEFPAKIEQSIATRDILLRVLTPAAAQSDWMAREAAHARSLHGKNSPRRVLNLLLLPGYTLSPQERDEIVIDATTQTEVEWLRALRLVLGIPERGRAINRRAFIGLGVAGIAALGGVAAIGKQLLFPNTVTPLFIPTTHAALATPEPNHAPPTLWRYRDGRGAGHVNLAVSGSALVAMFGSLLYSNLARIDSATGALLWETTYNLPAAATPLIHQGLIYTLGATNDLSQFQDLHIIAIDLATGAERWRSAAIAPGQDSLQGAQYGASLAMTSSIIVARWEDWLAAVNSATGALNWKVNLSTSSPSGAYPITGEDLMVSSPIIAGSRIYLGLEDGSIAAYDLVTGAPIWRSPVASARLSSDALVANGFIYIGSEDGYFYALDQQTGALRWKQALTQIPVLRKATGVTGSHFVTSAPTLVDGVLYVGAGNSGNLSLALLAPGLTTGRGAPPKNTDPVDDNLCALDATNGKVIWSIHPSLSAYPFAQYPLESVNDNGQAQIALDRLGLRTKPLVSGDVIYATSSLNFQNAVGPAGLNALYAIDRLTGAPLWTYTAAGYSLGFFPSAPALTQDGVIIFSSSYDVLTALKP
jgi:outer membrane protein assembly factor BamB